MSNEAQSTDGPRGLSTTLPIVDHVLREGLGMIPDPVEPWFHLRAIASVLGMEEKTLSNKRSDVRKAGGWWPDPHPVGNYYRIDDVVRALSNGNESQKATER